MGKGIIPHFPPVGAALENIVLKNTKNLFQPSKKGIPSIFSSNFLNKQKRSSIYNNDKPVDTDEDDIEHNDKSLWWANPPKYNLSIEFCEDTSINGLKFVVQKNRHLSERIFWIIAFLLGVIAAAVLIYDVWRRYEENPVIVSFQPKEQAIDTIPFPAVTFCNINKFPKKGVRDLEMQAKTSPNKKVRELAIQQLMYVRSVCQAQQSFAKEFDYAEARGMPDDLGLNDTIDEDHQDDLVEFIRDKTIPCDKLIRLCILGERKKDCGELFKPIVTDFGKCCTFNMLPLPLLHIDHNTDGKDDLILNPTPKVEIWSKNETDLWKQWKYEEGLIITDNQIIHPFRQKRAGLPYGLSVLIDPNLNQYYCPAADAEGFRFILHTPLEMPHVMDFASILGPGKETLIEIQPEVTNADDDIRGFTHKTRECYFGKERSLRFFRPYTGSNCIDECSALVITKKCNCSYFYMPRYEGVKVCNNDEDSADFKCIDEARIGLLDTLNEECGHCDSLCEDISYGFESTSAALQDASTLWKDHKNRSEPPEWANNQMSVVHIYFGSETTVPKLRKRLYADVDLIASTGGLLGLCLGFSILSGVEVIYFLTIRAFWKCYRRKRIGKAGAKKFVDILKRRGSKKRVINLDPNSLQLYPSFYPGFQNQYGLGKVYD